MTISATRQPCARAVNGFPFPAPEWQKACPSLDGLSPPLDDLSPSQKWGWLALEAPPPPGGRGASRAGPPGTHDGHAASVPAPATPLPKGSPCRAGVSIAVPSRH
jgi:hypothetical protein